MNERLQSLRRLLRERGLDGMLVTQPENRRYLSGFTGSSGALLVTGFVYLQQAAEQAAGFSIVRRHDGSGPDDFSSNLRELLPDIDVRRIGFEGHHLTVDQHRKLAGVLALYELVPVKGLLEGLREVKDAAELALIRKAVSLTDATFAYLMRTIRPGLTERAVAWAAERYMREHGASKLAFDVIVASGPNGALPHAIPTNRPLRAGEPILIDMGACVDGYHADLSRTICLGEGDVRFREIYGVVLRAQMQAEAGIRQGMTGKEVDALARKVIDGAGYGDSFGHALGHGLGLGMPEQPTAGRASDDRLRAGSVLTVEPGIYIYGWGGVRVEDVVLVGKEGVEVLSAAPKKPVIRI